MGRLVTLTLIAGALLTAAPAGACSIAYEPPKEQVAAADRAVYGQVEWVRPGEGNRYVAKLRLTRIYKGRATRAVRIRSHTDTGLCGIELRVGQRLGLTLDRPGPPYSASSGSVISRAELDEATGGRWSRPR